MVLKMFHSNAVMMVLLSTRSRLPHVPYALAEMQAVKHRPGKTHRPAGTPLSATKARSFSWEWLQERGATGLI